MEQADIIKKDEYRMQLAIATNPHCKASDQKQLWNALRPNRGGHKVVQLRPELREQAEAIKKELKEAKNGV